MTLIGRSGQSQGKERGDWRAKADRDGGASAPVSALPITRHDKRESEVFQKIQLMPRGGGRRRSRRGGGQVRSRQTSAQLGRRGSRVHVTPICHLSHRRSRGPSHDGSQGEPRTSTLYPSYHVCAESFDNHGEQVIRAATPLSKIETPSLTNFARH